MIRHPISEQQWQTTIRGLPVMQNVPFGLIDEITQDMSRPYRNGDVIFVQGQETQELFVILHGQVCIHAEDVFLVARQAGEVFGEQAWIERITRTASATAQGAAQVLAIPATIVERLMEEPIFLTNLLRLLSGKLSQATSERAFRYRVEELLFSEFRAHVSEPVLHSLVASGYKYGEPRFVDGIVLFSDIRSFTDLSAQMAPGEIAVHLGQYLDSIVEVVHKHGGMVDKFVGDAVMALWGYAPSERDIASQALACAREMVEVASGTSFGGKPVQIGVGLNAGTFFLGNIGGNGKRQFTALGTPVNLAARYETASKTLAAPVVAGQAFYDRLAPEDQAVLEPRPCQPVKGAPEQTLYACGHY